MGLKPHILPTSWPFSVKVGGEDQRAAAAELTAMRSQVQWRGTAVQVGIPAQSGRSRPPNRAPANVPDAPY